MHNLFTVYFVNLVVLVGLFHPNKTIDSNLKRIISTNCIHTVVPPDDGSRYARNMQRLTKYTENKLCIKQVFLYAINYKFVIILKKIPQRASIRNVPLHVSHNTQYTFSLYLSNRLNIDNNWHFVNDEISYFFYVSRKRRYLQSVALS